MKKKVTYKLEQTKSIIVEVETEEQEMKIKELNRDFERIDRQNRRIAAKTDSLERMYEETGYEPIGDTESPEEAMIRKTEKEELNKRIHNALGRLKPRQQQMITMLFFEGKTQEEVARTFGVTQQAISDSLQRVLAKLKNFLEEK